MYVIPIHVPIYTEGEKRFLTTEWHRSLILLRDSLQGKLGKIRLLAPFLPVDAKLHTQKLMPITKKADDIEVIPSFDSRCRARQYWGQNRKIWLAHLDEYTQGATAVHTTLDDLYRPIAYAGFQMAIKKNLPTIFVQDTDVASQTRELSNASSFIKSQLYALIFSRLCAQAIKKSDLALLKGKGLMQKYGALSPNTKEFQDTSHTQSDIIPQKNLQVRLERLHNNTPLRLVYAGRLVERKGIMDSLQILKRVIQSGSLINLDIIGDGPQREMLMHFVNTNNLSQQVHFLDARIYNAQFLKDLSEYDALFFTPLAEDTPRMIYDAFAAGLPLIAYDIQYVQERFRQDGAVVLLPFKNVESSAQILADLVKNRNSLLPNLSLKARMAGEVNTAESWYAKRAEWTFAAVAKKQKSIHAN